MLTYVIKLSPKYRNSERAKTCRNKMLRRLFDGRLPERHTECESVDIPEDDLDQAMTDVYKPTHARR